MQVNVCFQFVLVDPLFEVGAVLHHSYTGIASPKPAQGIDVCPRSTRVAIFQVREIAVFRCTIQGIPLL
jgi:hypothetical protein